VDGRRGCERWSGRVAVTLMSPEIAIVDSFGFPNGFSVLVAGSVPYLPLITTSVRRRLPFSKRVGHSTHSKKKVKIKEWDNSPLCLLNV